MKHFLSAVMVGLMCVASPVAAQTLQFDGMVTTDKEFENFAVSAVSSPVASLSLGKSVSVDGVILPSVIVNRKLEDPRLALGIGAVIRVGKWDFGYAAFRKEGEWHNHYGLVVKF